MSSTELNKNQEMQKSSNEPRTVAEWVSLIVSLLLLAAVVGVILTLWIQDAGKPAAFRVEIGRASKIGSQFHLPVTVTNYGDVTAANVVVQGKLMPQSAKSGGGDQKTTTNFDFVPPHARAEGILVFTEDPSSADVRVTSFQPP